ncbi:IclR family transcriptional regulator [Streptomyces sp. NPDC001549]|uniref:IclR family transcriptional regulator n=1 Tax=Streptomyces sp. NPDC001549 TaxID=3364586 RepID=UPI003693905F
MQLVKRALGVVTALSQESAGLTLQQLADRLEIPEASMYRLLAVLKEEHFVTRAEGSRRYFAGPAAWEVGSSTRRSGHLAERSSGVLAELADTVGEPVLFTELVGRNAVCTGRFGPEREAPLSARVGRTLPFHAATAARTLLVGMEEHRIRRLLCGSDFARYRPRTPRGVHDVLHHLFLARRNGYGVSYDEYDQGIWAVSAPVRGGTGHVLATVTTAGSEHRMNQAARRRARQLVLEAAHTLGSELGHRGTGGHRPCAS